MIIVDRIENGLAVCEIDGKMADIPLLKISNNVREGDVLTGNEDCSFYTIDIAKTEQRRAYITERFERLKARHKK
ncbi:MAG: DUF3006 domain-containing protein [Nitrososphaerota archaeon]|jgi:hypothetical protein|nr:DUF3006 domain-containing protein [Nitrososphaerota archaeon]